MKVSDAIAEFLAFNGIRYVFGYQGGSVTHLIDSISRQKGIEYIQNFHEQGAAFSADAYARVSKEGIGVAIGTNGPGATNLVTGIANAYCDSIPVLFLTGQVHTYAMKGNKEYRQESFQEIDIISIARSITKYCVTVVNKNDVIPSIRKAIAIAKGGRPGPVLVDLPVDIQGEFIAENIVELEKDELKKGTYQKEEAEFKELCTRAAKLISAAERPLFICGGGITEEGKVLISEIVKDYRIPIVCSLMGLDKISHSIENFIGFIGAYGNRYANWAVQNADVVAVVGSRLDQRQTGKNKKAFAENAKIIHIDIDPIELKHNTDEEISIFGDSTSFLKNLIDSLKEYGRKENEEWLHQIKGWKKDFPSTNELRIEGINPNHFMACLGKAISDDTVICADVGQNQMWLAQSLRVSAEKFRILNSGGLGAMGYALPASIGAYYANRKCKCIAVMGDGGIQMNIQELQLIGAECLPIIIFVLNNHALGMIRDVHTKYYNNNFEGSVRGFSCPPLNKIADAYGLGYRYFDEEKNFELLGDIVKSEIPMLVEINLSQNTRVAPELMGMSPLNEQVPVV